VSFHLSHDLGVVLDRQLSLDTHVTAVYSSSYYQLRQLWPIARSLSVEAAKSLVQAFISSSLDYCNATLHGLPDRLIRRLQSVQNAAARIITGAPRAHGMTTSHQYCNSSTGYQYDDVSSSRSPSWFTSAWLVRHLVTRHRNVSSSPMSALANFDQQSQSPVSCAACTTSILRQPMLCSCRSMAMELATNQSKTVSVWNNSSIC